MAEPSTQSSESNTPKLSAVKDKHCPYCNQAFTSSSLGRHLDLYIKEKNPKPPDGIHDVDAIKKLRGGITRRQTRGSIGGRGDDTTPTGTPRPSTKSGTPSRETESARSGIPKDGQYVVDTSLSRFPFNSRWEATGVINDLPAKGPWEGEASQEASKRPAMQRTVSRQVAHKAQFDAKHKLADAMDTARAAELALRELFSSWRAAKVHIDNHSLPFDFDPLSLDFPALTLQCLDPPPTLFSSTQHPTSTSWSVQSPGKREYGALEAYFEKEFQAYKVACATATTDVMGEMSYPPNRAGYKDTKDAVRTAEKVADNLAKQVSEHLLSSYTVWEALPIQRQHELWILELARGVGRKHKENKKMQEEQHRIKQENENLKSQIDQLNRLQQPREFKILSPTNIPIGQDLVRHAFEQGLKAGNDLGVGFDINDRHVDLGTLVTNSIGRWKNVITSTRVASGGMSAQQSLNVTNQASAAASIQSPSQPLLQTPQQSQPPNPPKRQSTASTNGAASDHTAPSTTNTGPPSVDASIDEEMSDQDADAEMDDDDSFAIMNASPVKTTQPQMHPQPTLNVPRTRGSTQQQQQQQQQQRQQQQQLQQGTADMRYMMPNGANSPVGRATVNMSRSMPNMNMAMQGNAIHRGDMSMAMQGVQGDSMYME